MLESNNLSVAFGSIVNTVNNKTVFYYSFKVLFLSDAHYILNHTHGQSFVL